MCMMSTVIMSDTAVSHLTFFPPLSLASLHAVTLLCVQERRQPLKVTGSYCSGASDVHFQSPRANREPARTPRVSRRSALKLSNLQGLHQTATVG